MGGMGEDRPSYSPAHPSGRAPQKFFDRCAVTSTEGADPVFSGRGKPKNVRWENRQPIETFLAPGGEFPKVGSHPE